MSELKTGNPQILGIISLVPARRLVVPWSTALSARCLLTLSLAPICKIISTLQLFGKVWPLDIKETFDTLSNYHLQKHCSLQISRVTCLTLILFAEEAWVVLSRWSLMYQCDTFVTFDMSHIVTYHIWDVTHCHIWHVTSCHLSFVKLVKYDMSHAKLFYPTQLLCPMLNFSICSLMLTSKMVFFK